VTGVAVVRALLLVFGVALLLWGAWDNTKNPSDPEPFTWTGLLLKVLLITFFYLLATALFRVFS